MPVHTAGFADREKNIFTHHEKHNKLGTHPLTDTHPDPDAHKGTHTCLHTCTHTHTHTCTQNVDGF